MAASQRNAGGVRAPATLTCYDFKRPNLERDVSNLRSIEDFQRRTPRSSEGNGTNAFIARSVGGQ